MSKERHVLSIPVKTWSRPNMSVKCVMLIAMLGCISTPFASVSAEDGSKKIRLQKTPSTDRELIKLYIEEASRRFLIPSPWIWAVMRVESAGDASALSNKGAMGLMQIMSDTWTMLRLQHGLGDDPYDPRDNILAGASYLRDLHHRYGEAGFLAAYNAGPGRYEEHLRSSRSLPAETIDYVSKVSRFIGLGAPSDGFLRAYSGSGVAESDLFVRSGFETVSDHEADDNRSKNHLSVSLQSDQRVVGLSAITPQASGLFVRLSDR